MTVWPTRLFVFADFMLSMVKKLDSTIDDLH
jgi:hypothetical protein